MLFRNKPQDTEELEQFDILHVQIASIERLIWKGEAVAVSSMNSKGAFDVLPRHQKFITLIRDSPITVQTLTEKKTFQFKTCILHVSENAVSMYVNL